MWNCRRVSRCSYSHLKIWKITCDDWWEKLIRKQCGGPRGIPEQHSLPRRSLMVCICNLSDAHTYFGGAEYRQGGRNSKFKPTVLNDEKLRRYDGFTWRTHIWTLSDLQEMPLCSWARSEYQINECDGFSATLELMAVQSFAINRTYLFVSDLHLPKHRHNFIYYRLLQTKRSMFDENPSLINSTFSNVEMEFRCVFRCVKL